MSGVKWRRREIRFPMDEKSRQISAPRSISLRIIVVYAVIGIVVFVFTGLGASDVVKKGVTNYAILGAQREVVLLVIAILLLLSIMIRHSMISRRNEAALRTAKEELEKRVAERTAELRGINSKIEHILSKSPAVLYSCRVGEGYRTTFISDNVETLVGFGPEEFSGDFWESRIHPEDREWVLNGLEQLTGRDCRAFEYRFLHKDGAYRWLHDEVKLVADADGIPSECIGYWIDISERKRAELALSESEKKYRLLVETAQEGIWAIDADARTTYVNPRMGEMLGYTVEEMMGRQVFDFIDRQFREICLTHLARRKRGVKEHYDGELLRKDGVRLYVHLEAVPLMDEHGTYVGGFAMIADITDRKMAEAELKAATDRLRTLSRSLLEKLENERRHIARELHDETGQALTAVKMMLQSLRRGPSPDQQQIRITETIEVVEDAISQVRDLSLFLRPAVLDDLGLAPALRWHISRLGQMPDGQMRFVADQLERRFPKEIETACFRVAQEALTNALRHARARLVTVELRLKDSTLYLAVRDDGAGFEISSAMEKTGRGECFGLLGMQERVALAGGALTVTSKPEKGTLIQAYFPMGEDAS